mmetsp:Transcript_14083/g.38535  ORF Transcript_14083/g.38535 Transcript_14083/m.38535 type:complete len:381 (-) Transcript_14083:114-1256(-)
MDAFRKRLGRACAGVGASELEADLRRVTDAGVIDVSKEALHVLVQHSYNEDDRRVMMRHLRACLAEGAAAQWRRVYLGLLVVEALFKNGSTRLISETAQGFHFDLVQRLSFLENYEYGFDKRVQDMVRRKASSLRAAWLRRQLEVEEGAHGGAHEICAQPPPAHDSARPNASEAPPDRKVSKAPHTLLVNVGHNEDTSSGSDDDGAGAAKASQRRSGGKQGKNASPLEDSTTDGGSSRSSNGSSPPAVQVAQAPLDLLGEDPEVGATSIDRAGAERGVDLIDTALMVDLLDSVVAPQVEKRRPDTSPSDLLLVDTEAVTAAHNTSTAGCSSSAPPMTSSLPAAEAAAAPAVDWLAVAKAQGLHGGAETKGGATTGDLLDM